MKLHEATQRTAGSEVSSIQLLPGSKDISKKFYEEKSHVDLRSSNLCCLRVNCMSFSVWLISLSLRPWRPMHVVTSGRKSCLYKQHPPSSFVWLVFILCSPACCFVFPLPGLDRICPFCPSVLQNYLVNTIKKSFQSCLATWSSLNSPLI